MTSIHEHVFEPGTELCDADKRILNVYVQMFPEDEDEETDGINDIHLRKQEFAADKNHCFVLTNDSEVYVVANYLNDPSSSEGEVFAIVTAPEKRGLGYGALMMNYLMDRAREDGNTHLSLVLGSKRSLSFYDRLGFTKIDPDSMRMMKEL